MQKYANLLDKLLELAQLQKLNQKKDVQHKQKKY